MSVIICTRISSSTWLGLVSAFPSLSRSWGIESFQHSFYLILFMQISVAYTLFNQQIFKKIVNWFSYKLTSCQTFHFSITILPLANHPLQFTFSHPWRLTDSGFLSTGEVFVFQSKLRSSFPFWLFSFPKLTLKNEGN